METHFSTYFFKLLLNVSFPFIQSRKSTNDTTIWMYICIIVRTYQFSLKICQFLFFRKIQCKNVKIGTYTFLFKYVLC